MVYKMNANRRGNIGPSGFIFPKLLKYFMLPTAYMVSAFEMWWHTRRNQISSFGETDESI